jgi:flagellin-like protein
MLMTCYVDWGLIIEKVYIYHPNLSFIAGRVLACRRGQNMRMSNKKEAVSPVIAVILMVAITVVLAAVLYVMVSGLITDTQTTPRLSMQAANSADGHNWTISMTGFTQEILLKDLTMVLTDSNGIERASIEDLTGAAAANYTLNDDGGNYVLVFNKGSGSPTELSASQSFVVFGVNANNADSTTNYAEDYILKMIYDPSGDSVDTVTLT